MRYDYSLLFAVAAVGLVIGGRRVVTSSAARAASDAAAVKPGRPEKSRDTGPAVGRPAPAEE